MIESLLKSSPARSGLPAIVKPDVSEGMPSALVGPPLAAAVLFLLATSLMLSRARELTGGQFSYAVDDAYIHMAVAKTLVLHHVYGVTPYEVTTSASSILWPWLLAACFSLFGIHETIPLALNMIFAIAILFIANRAMIDFGGPAATPVMRLIALVVLAIAAPMPVMVVIGMEHLLHGACVLGLAVLAVRVLSGRAYGPAILVALTMLASLSTGVRYEGVSAVLAVVLLLALKRRWAAAVVVALGAATPILVQGVVA